MNIKEELKQILIYDSKINNALEELSKLKALSTKITTAYGGDIVGGTHSTDKMCDIVSRIDEKMTEINNLVDAYVDMKCYYSALINQLTDRVQIDIMHGHYFQGKPLVVLSQELGYTYRNICYTHGRALYELNKIKTQKPET